MRRIRITHRKPALKMNFISRKLVVLKAQKLREKHDRLLKSTKSFLLIPTAFTALAVYSMIEQGLILLAAMTTFAFVGAASLYLVKIIMNRTHKIRKEEIPNLLR